MSSGNIFLSHKFRRCLGYSIQDTECSIVIPTEAQPSGGIWLRMESDDRLQPDVSLECIPPRPFTLEDAKEYG